MWSQTQMGELMTLKEFREKFAESEHKEWLNELSISIKYDHLNERVQKEGITDIYRFFKTQGKEWNKFPDNLPIQLSKVREYYNDCATRIENYIQNIQNRGVGELRREWGNLRNTLNLTKTDNNRYKILPADAPEISFLIHIHRDYSDSFTGAYDYLIWNRVNNANLNNSEKSSAGYLRGVNLAYEFEVQDHTEILQRRSNEKKSLGQLRSNFEEYLSEVETSTADYFKKTKENFDSHSDKIIDLKEAKEKKFDDWFGTSINEYKDFYSKMQSDANEMKELFRDGLRFAGPVKHWRRRALKMKKDGAFWIKWLIGSSIIVAISLFVLLIVIPEGITTSLFEGDALAIKWAILYVTFISFMVYAVRTFAKLTFSSYHLSRDAEEREQLTHVYLALKKDGNVEEKDRVLILQALFSRAETGLLKEDSSPTLPGNSILNKINGSN